MALGNRNANLNYVKLKDGKFFLGKDTETPYSELEGSVTKAYYRDEEFEGAPIRKFIMVLSDDSGDYQLSLNVESSSYGGLISFLKNVDVTKPLTLHPKMEISNKDGKEITKRTILVSQDGKFAKSYFTKDNPHGLPAWNVVKVGNKKVTDKTEYLEFLEAFVKNEIFVDRAETPVKKEVTAKEDDVEESTDTSLPWD